MLPGSVSLAIVPQIWETMIRMSRTDCRVFQTICGLVLVVAGCCGGGPSHKCDFTPPDVPGIDAGSDGPIPCGTEICEGAQVCCLKKSPPVAFCIPPTDFVKQGCEKLALPCMLPKDCPRGLSCCFTISDPATFAGSVTCAPNLLCPGDGVKTYIACGMDIDCPATRPTCVMVSPEPQPFSICE